MFGARSYSQTRNTIFALASGAGKAAVALIRISGPDTQSVLSALTGSPAAQPRQAQLLTLRDPETRQALDKALVIWFPAPRSFTGEDVAELHVTGGRAVVRRVSGCLSRLPGLRPAEPGEFAWRAFEHGKLDLSEVEGLADLVDAETEAQHRQAMNLAGGGLRRAAMEVRDLVLNAMSLMESQIDFSDVEEVDLSVIEVARQSILRAASRVRRILSEGRRGERIREGLNIVIAGPPNAGKSTLMNVLAKRDVSIVSPTPGTTRDLIEVSMDLDGFPVTLVDTAGIRETTEPIENLGIERALRRAQAADLTLWLFASGTEPEPPSLDATKVLWTIETKCDEADSSKVPSVGERSRLRISALNGDGIDRLLDELAAFASEELEGAGTVLMTTERHRIAFADAAEALDRASAGDMHSPELVAEDLRLAARAMERISGRIDVEDVLGDIFSRLCVGK